MGPGKQEATEADLACAFEVGKIVAELGATLLCGGMSGTMEASARGAKESGGLTVGIGPTGDKADMNPHIDLPLLTNMHAGRNYMNVISSDVMVFVTIGSPGTLSELAHAIQAKMPSIVIGGSAAVKVVAAELSAENVSFVDTVEEVQTKLAHLLG